MRDRQQLAAGLLFVLGHPLPELFRVFALPGREREHLVGLVLVVAEQDVAVQVVAARHRGPFVADHRGEAARLVELLRRGGVLLPHRLHDRADDLGVLDGRRQGALRLAGHHVVGGVRGGLAAFLHRLVPSDQDRILHECGIAFIDLEHQPQALGVVGDHQKVQRARQLGRHAGGRDHLFAAREAVRLLRRQPVAGHEGIAGIGGVVVRVAEEDPRRELAPGVGRIFLLHLDLGRSLGFAGMVLAIVVIDRALDHDVVIRRRRCAGLLRQRGGSRVPRPNVTPSSTVPGPTTIRTRLR